MVSIPAPCISRAALASHSMHLLSTETCLVADGFMATLTFRALKLLTSPKCVSTVRYTGRNESNLRDLFLRQQVSPDAF